MFKCKKKKLILFTILTKEMTKILLESRSECSAFPECLFLFAFPLPFYCHSFDDEKTERGAPKRAEKKPPMEQQRGRETSSERQTDDSIRGEERKKKVNKKKTNHV